MKLLNNIIRSEFEELNFIRNKILNDKYFLKKFTKITLILSNAIKKKKKIIFFGNGGSAADALHLATELVVKYKKKRKALPALALSSNTANITAIGNDYNFKYIFSRQLEAIGQQGDVAFGISTSGNSLNVIEGIKFAKKNGITPVIFSGNNGGKLKSICKNLLIIPSKKTSIIQIYHLFFGQLICDYLENQIK